MKEKDTFKEFYTRWIEAVRDNGGNYAAGYKTAENEHKEIYGFERFSNYQSFKQSKHYHKNKLI